MDTEAFETGVLEHWTPKETKKALERGEIVLIDVRTPQEFALERIDGALLSPMHSLRPAHMPGQTDKRIVFHCGSGVRSGKVAEKCLAGGFGRVAHMKGGFAAWKDAGLEYTGTDMATGAPKVMRKSD
ncbi:rhodanese-like domain-containing protein [Pseudosulfitobacter koreensis]|uniref:Rhodanese-like domain-containing protein n=1 Tax=Pseudosulfitobacter koreensis TaxID=2968472 RepID=A0ABT1Z4H3_9RHOB|nr:rhodanese-like domain-containing protein [Pseudosulfitobacter koreense]MCR8828030.1 rhodanese-like domain-containing protein [Pseudosulfitobacter koreense]